ncbi:hypothetical protein ES703_58133 [subsurface metagenome]
MDNDNFCHPHETLTGVGGEPPGSESKVVTEDPPVILTNTANLDDSLILPLYPPKECSPKYMVLQCSCGRRIVPSTCMGLDCEICHPYVGQRRANSVLRRLLGSTLYQKRQHWSRAVIYTVFTVPPAIRERFYFEKAAWQKVRKKAWRILKTHFGGRFGVEATHPSGDSNTGRFHPHLNFLWIQRDGYRPFLDIKLLRYEWARVLKTLSVDVYSQYSNDVVQIIHWVKYVARTFPGSHKWTGPLRWYGNYPKMVKPHDVGCCDCKQRFTLIGWIDARHVDEYCETGIMIGRDPPWYDDKYIIRSKRGPPENFEQF